MIIPALIAKAFSKSSAPKRPKTIIAPKNNISPIPYISFTKAFQTFQDKLYSIEENVPTDDEDIEIFAETYKYISSPVFHQLNDKEWTDISIHSLLMKPNSCISFLEYTHEAKEIGAQDWASLLICAREDFYFYPHVSITGRRIETPQGISFVPIEALCLSTHTGQPEYIPGLDDEMFAGMMNYANQAMLQIINEEDLDIKENQKWLSPRKLAHAELSMKKMRDRSLSTLHEDAQNYKLQKQPSSTYATGPVINT